MNILIILLKLFNKVKNKIYFIKQRIKYKNVYLWNKHFYILK